MKTNRFSADVLALSTGAEVEWNASGGVWLSLHSEDPEADGDQTTNELSYNGYERIFIEADLWEAAENVKSAVELRWPKAARDMQGEKVATFIGLGLKGSGTGYLGRRLEMTDPMHIKSNTIPAVEKGKLKLTEA